MVHDLIHAQSPFDVWSQHKKMTEEHWNVYPFPPSRTHNPIQILNYVFWAIEVIVIVKIQNFEDFF